MLSHEETLQKISEAQAGNKQSAEVILLENMPLIKSVIKRYRNNNIEYDDLIQLGSLGLIKAVMNFNPSFNVRFSTYAVPMIAGEIKRHIRDDGPIKVSRQTKSLVLAINKFVEEFRSQNDREPSVQEIADKFEISTYDVVFALDSARMPVSLFEKYDDDGTYLVDVIKTEDRTDEILDKLALKQIIGSLCPRDKKIIILRYYRDKTQSEVAKIMGVSQVQISRLETKILNDIRKKMS